MAALDDYMLNAQQKAFNDAGEAAKAAGKSKSDQLLAGQTAAGNQTPVAGAITPNYSATNSPGLIQTDPTVTDGQNSGKPNSGNTTTSNNGSDTPNYGFTPATGQGQAYIDRISQTLAGNDPLAQNERNTAQTQDAMSTYLAKKTAAQTSADAGYTPGTLQSQRTQDRGLAVSDAANLQRDNSVNTVQRQDSQDALTAEQGIEANAEAKDSTLINSVTDPKFQAYLRQVQARGGNVQQAYDQGETNGTVNPEYRSMTPEATKLQGFVDQVKTGNPGISDADAQAQALVLYNNSNKTTNNPVTTATITQSAQDIQTKINNGQGSTIDFTDPNVQAAVGQAPVLSYASADALGGTQNFVTANAGKLVTFNGSPYVVDSYNKVPQSNGHNADFVTVTDPKTGNKSYINLSAGTIGTDPAILKGQTPVVAPKTTSQLQSGVK